MKVTIKANCHKVEAGYLENSWTLLFYLYKPYEWPLLEKRYGKAFLVA